MDKYEELANAIINLVSDDLELKNPALINGLDYWKMEEEIVRMIKEVE